MSATASFSYRAALFFFESTIRFLSFASGTIQLRFYPEVPTLQFYCGFPRILVAVDLFSKKA